jgi:hypothetical protein
MNLPKDSSAQHCPTLGFPEHPWLKSGFLPGGMVHRSEIERLPALSTVMGSDKLVEVPSSIDDSFPFAADADAFHLTTSAAHPAFAAFVGLVMPLIPRSMHAMLMFSESSRPKIS